MKDKSQTPAPKVSSKGTHKEKGQRKEPAIEHLESGYSTGINPENEVIKDTLQQTTAAQQESREKKIKERGGSLDIPSGMEGE
jgi:hypothetical protein